ncbi:MAG TPA: CatB-related O-acetyltransferase [Candidatus Angelobacter sp.]|jgi:acetyltransferase-like isoleucine patch superfamily enzyme|nr:CatB-related O-acetyltransferase [Candidatus Angelobacter sp.]
MAIFGPIQTPSLLLGKFSYFAHDFELITWFPGETITIGNYCSIGARVVFCTGGMRRTDTAALYPFDVQRAYRTTPTTTIGNDVWVGYGSMITKGAKVGDGAIIASGSVVFSDVPPFSVVAGNPSQIIRYRFSKPVIERLLRIAWWHWPDQKVFANVDWFYRPIQEFIDHFDPPGEVEHG